MINTKMLKAFKLTKVSSAYWRADANNKTLQRVYGVSFPDKKDLKAYLTMMQEAEKRDHRILGSKLKLFSISPLVGSGLPLIQPNGVIIRDAVLDYLWDLHKDKGYQ